VVESLVLAHGVLVAMQGTERVASGGPLGKNNNHYQFNE